MPLCLCLLPNFSPGLLPSRGFTQLQGNPELCKRLSIYSLQNKQTNKQSHTANPGGGAGRVAHTIPVSKAAPASFGSQGVPRVRPRLLCWRLCAALSPGRGVAGEGRAPDGAPFGVWAFPPRSLATKPPSSPPRRAPPNRLRPPPRGGLRAGAPALPRPLRPPPDRKELKEQRGSPRERAWSVGPARNRPWKRSNLSRAEATWVRVELHSPRNLWAPEASGLRRQAPRLCH